MGRASNARDVDQIILSMRSSLALPTSSKAKIAKSPPLQKFILSLAEHVPVTMGPILKKAIKACDAARESAAAERESRKRKDYDQEEIRPAKQPKFTRVRRGATVPAESNMPKVSNMENFRVKESTDSSEWNRFANISDLPSDEVDNDEELPICPNKFFVPEGYHAIDSNECEEESTTDMGTESVMEVKYQIEFAITNGVEDSIGPIRAQCMALSHELGEKGNRGVQLSDIFETCRSFSFTSVKLLLTDFMNDRLGVPDIKKEKLSTWGTSEPGEIFDALMVIYSRDADTQIHKAFGQMQLFLSVNARAPTSNGPTRRSASKIYLDVLEDLANQKAAGAVSIEKKLRIVKDYRDEYNCGKKLLEVVGWFGGPGIVLVFVTASKLSDSGFLRLCILTASIEIGCSHAASAWSGFQRLCVQHISQFLPSIKALVKALGKEVLADYCRRGYFSEESIEKINSVEGC